MAVASANDIALADLVVISGLSGAGKTAATKLFEDLGYTCMDNLPGELLPDLAELVSSDRQRFEKVAIVLDVRAGNAPLALALALPVLVFKLAVGGFLLALIETLSAKMRIFRVPEFLGTAFLLAVIGLLVNILLGVS